MAVERTTEARDLSDLSPSRVLIASKCGLAFKYRYVDRLPAPSQSASAIFGSAVHRGVAAWYGEGPRSEDNFAQHKDLDLVDCVRQQWPLLLVEGFQAQADDPDDQVPQVPKIWEFVEQLIELDQERLNVAEAIKLKRPQLKNPMQTKDFLASEAHKQFTERREQMRELADKVNEVHWPNDEDAYAAYQKSEQIARRLQAQWKPLPRPLTVEEPFRLEFEGFVMRGQIDQVRQDPNPETGELGPARIADMKMGRNLHTPMEGFMQGFIYYEANQQIDWLPDTNLVEFWMGRHPDAAGNTKVQRATIQPERHKRLALKVLNGVGRLIITAQFEPHYGMWCKSCDFRDLCEDEIALWDGDGVLVGNATTS